jgi:leucyl/phenylalanyl-tRNA--protein transferase
MLDAQVTTRHLLSLGAQEIPRNVFLEKLRVALQFPTMRGRWNVESR